MRRSRCRPTRGSTVCGKAPGRAAIRYVRHHHRAAQQLAVGHGGPLHLPVPAASQHVEQTADQVTVADQHHAAAVGEVLAQPAQQLPAAPVHLLDGLPATPGHLGDVPPGGRRLGRQLVWSRLQL